MTFPTRFTLVVMALAALQSCYSFTPATSTTITQRNTQLLACKSDYSGDNNNNNNNKLSRRSLFQSTLAAGIFSLTTSTASSLPALAAERAPLEDLLYTIVRVREATQQETRLIKSGKFKDVARQNVKLAVKFMIENYKLNDAFLAASNYLDGGNKRMAAVNTGQTAVQDLYTILEYFDSSDVQNLKIGSSTLSSDKLDVVLKGLDATRKNIDEFLAYFPPETVDKVKAKVKEENDLNFKEFDRGLGDIVNPNPV